MKENPYKMALAEVDMILSYTDNCILEKIPDKFKKFVKDNKQKEYKVAIESAIPLKEQKILEETKLILALLYRDYICEKEKRNELVELENQQKRIIEKQKHDKFDIVFNDKNRKINNCDRSKNIKEENQLISVIIKDKWYKRALNKLKKWLNLKK